MKETFEDYLQRLKDRRTEDNYKYTDKDFKDYIHYIFNCYEANLSVYKCLEFMYFAEKDMDDQLFNREPKQQTVEEYFLDDIKNMLQFNNDALVIRFMEKYYHAKKEQEGSYSDEDMVIFVSFVGKNYIKAKGFYYMKGDFEKKHKVSIHQILEQFKKR